MHWLNLISYSLILLLVGGIPAFATYKKVDLFASFTDGAKDGFQLAVKILPHLVAFFVAIGMFRAAGGFDLLTKLLAPLLNLLGIPSKLIPMILIRPFSGSATLATLAHIAHQNGGNSYLAHAAATLMGSTETTFYILMVYFGSVGISRTRHAVLAGLIADMTGALAAIYMTHLFFH